MNKIDQLPIEILIKIFNYLPSFKKVSLVNKLFCKVARMLIDPKICLKIDGNSMDRQTVMETIENMERKISKLVIHFPRSDNSQWQATDIEAIIRKFSATIKYFELHYASINMSNFIQILSLLPNVEHLNFLGVRVLHCHYPLSDECFTLRQLRTLELFSCNEQILVPFNKMQDSNLHKLSLTLMLVELDLMAGFLTHQHNIKDVILSAFEKFDPLLFDRLELESLYCKDIECGSSLATILPKQSKLKDLTINASDGRIFNIITGELQGLVKLFITVNYNSGLPFESLSKLKQLKHLTIDLCSPEIMEILCGFDNSRLSTLSLEGMDSINGAPMTVNLICLLAKSAPNLKELQLDWSLEIENAVAVMRSFNFLEVLEMSVEPDIDVNILAEKIKSCINLKLSTLRITGLGHCNERLLEKLIKIYPNLIKITIDSDLYCLNESIDPSKFVTNSQLQLMLDGFTKIQSVELYFPDIKLTKENCDLIVKYKTNFDSIIITKDEDMLSAEWEEQLKTAFDFVRYYDEKKCFHLKLMKIIN